MGPFSKIKCVGHGEPFGRLGQFEQGPEVGVEGAEVGLSGELIWCWRRSAPLATALVLNADEKDYLFAMAGRPLPVRQRPTESASAAVLAVMRSLEPCPVLVTARSGRVLALNRPAEGVFGESADRWFLDLLFTPECRGMIGGWETVASRVVADLRADWPTMEGEAQGQFDRLRHDPDFRRSWEMCTLDRSYDPLVVVDGRQYRFLRLSVDQTADVRLEVFVNLPEQSHVQQSRH